MLNKLIIIQFDYSGSSELLSYDEVLDVMEDGTSEIYTTCLEFFSFSSLNKGYDVKVVKFSGEYILLSELLDNDGSYTNRKITKSHDVRKLLVANEFKFKK